MFALRPLLSLTVFAAVVKTSVPPEYAFLSDELDKEEGWVLTEKYAGFGKICSDFAEKNLSKYELISGKIPQRTHYIECHARTVDPANNQTNETTIQYAVSFVERGFYTCRMKSRLSDTYHIFGVKLFYRWDCYISFGWNWLNPIDDYRYVVGTMICIVCMAGMLSNAFVMYLSRADQEVAKNDYSIFIFFSSVADLLTAFCYLHWSVFHVPALVNWAVSVEEPLRHLIPLRLVEFLARTANNPLSNFPYCFFKYLSIKSLTESSTFNSKKKIVRFCLLVYAFYYFILPFVSCMLFGYVTMAAQVYYGIKQWGTGPKTKMDETWRAVRIAFQFGPTHYPPIFVFWSSFIPCLYWSIGAHRAFGQRLKQRGANLESLPPQRLKENRTLPYPFKMYPSAADAQWHYVVMLLVEALCSLPQAITSIAPIASIATIVAIIFGLSDNKKGVSKAYGYSWLKQIGYFGFLLGMLTPFLNAVSVCILYAPYRKAAAKVLGLKVKKSANASTTVKSINRSSMTAGKSTKRRGTRITHAASKTE